MVVNNVTVVEGGSSISGVFVNCYDTLEHCLRSCYMSCYITDYCNDSPGAVACAPALTSMIVLTLLFVVTLCGCCCVICFCSPCCLCAIWYKKRRSRHNRGVQFASCPSAPPLLSGA